jgi:glutamine amidotransferase
VVLPGQGAMPDCMRELRESGLEAAVRERGREQAAARRLHRHADAARRSEEATRGGTPGLGLIGGEVCAFASRATPGRRQPLQGAADGLERGDPGAAAPDLARRARSQPLLFRAQLLRRPVRRAPQCGETDYGGRFTSALARDNIFATQFHPEKERAHGLALYRNFLNWNP